MGVVQSRTIGPTLGTESINDSVLAGSIGLVAVAVFMILYYRLPGVLAVLALMLYTMTLFALFKLIPVTLTLPEPRMVTSAWRRTVASILPAPAIVSIQKTFEEIRTKEIARYRKKKLKHLSGDDFGLIEELTKQIMTESLHNPIMNLKRHHRISRDDNAKREHLHLQTKFIEELFRKNGDA